MARNSSAFLLQFGGNLFLAKGRAKVLAFAVANRLHGDQIDHAREVRFGADGNLQRHRHGAQTLFQLADNLVEVGTVSVHFVDVGDARHAVTVGLTPHGFGLRLHAADGTKHRDQTVQNAQAALDFDGEVDVSGRIDDVDGVLRVLLFGAVPEAGGSGGCDGDAAFLFLGHPVHRGGSVVDFADAVADAGVEQNAFRGGSFTGVDVGSDADVASQREIFRHDVCFPWPSKTVGKANGDGEIEL